MYVEKRFFVAIGHWQDNLIGSFWWRAELTEVHCPDAGRRRAASRHGRVIGPHHLATTVSCVSGFVPRVGKPRTQDGSFRPAHRVSID